MKIEGRTYVAGDVRLDGNTYVNCRFERCRMVYSGFAPVTAEGCEFIEVRWVLADHADNTIQFLIGLYHGAGQGGREIVERLFDNIRNLPPQLFGADAH